VQQQQLLPATPSASALLNQLRAAANQAIDCCTAATTAATTASADTASTITVDAGTADTAAADNAAIEQMSDIISTIDSSNSSVSSSATAGATGDVLVAMKAELRHVQRLRSILGALVRATRACEGKAIH
jgi:hypothetical protein